MHQIVIPAYNEQARLPRTLRELRRHVSAHRGELGQVEVIVVDNASTDATAAVARRADSPAMPVRVVRCEVRGKGAAVAFGVAQTDAPIVSFMDADGATRLDALERGVRRLRSGVEVVIGSRNALGSATEARHSLLRDRGARVYRSLSSRLVSGIGDTQCGFKIFQGDLARALFADLRTRGFSFDVEILARAAARGARIEELSVWWVDVPGSTFTPVRHGASSFAQLAAIAWRGRGERYVPAVLPVPVVPVGAAATGTTGHATPARLTVVGR